MSVIHIVCGYDKPKNIAKDDIVFWWDKYDIAPNEFSIPTYYKENFLSLRKDLLDFFYDLGLKEFSNKPLYQWLNAGDRLSMWWCSVLFEKHPILMPELHEILKLRCLEQMLEKFAPSCTQLKLYSNNVKLNAVIKEYCSKKALKFSSPKHKLSCKLLLKNLVQTAKNYTIIHIFFAALRFLHWLISIRFNVEYIKESPIDKPCITIATYFPTPQKNSDEADFFYSPHWEPLQKQLLKAKKNINWLLIRINSPSISFKQAVAKANKYNEKKVSGASFHFAEEFLSMADIWQALRRYFRLCGISYRLKKHVRLVSCLGYMNVWPYLEPYFLQSFQGWRCLERCLQRKAMLSYVAWAGVQEYTLFPLENCPWERMLTEAIHHNKAGLVYGAQHSVVRASDFRYFDGPKLFNCLESKSFLPHKILVNGHAAYENMLAAGTPKQLLHNVEALRYLHLQKYQQASVSKSKNTKQLIVVTSFFPSIVQEHIKLLAKWFYEKSDGTWKICIKEHPYCSVKPALKKYFTDIEQLEVTNKSIDMLLDEASKNSSIMWVANDSTVIVEAIYAKIPLLVQNEGSGIDFCPLQGIDALKYVYTCEDVQSALEQKQILHLHKEFFTLNVNDVELPKWRALLNI